MRRLVLGLGCLLLAAATLGAGREPAAAASCPSSNRPNRLVVAGGNPQTAKLGRPFQESFQVALANTNGCPLTGALAGTGIEFVAPAGGASGTFATTGTNTAVVGTNEAGVAAAPSFTANDTEGTYTVHAVSDYGTVVFTVTNTSAGVAVAIAADTGGGQSATVDGAYGQPLVARVTDAAGRPVQGVSVSFALTPNPYGAGAAFLGGGAQASETTNASGLATSPPIVANGTPGRFTATASTNALSSVATFDLDNHAAATTVAAIAPSGAATVGRRFPQPLRARVLDAFGQPIEGVSVTFTLSAAHDGAGASFLGGSTQAVALADADGVATSPPVVANTSAGSFTATAAAAGDADPAAYALVNRAGKPATIVAGAAAEQSARVRSRFPVRLAVTVTDRDGNPVPKAVVAFSAPARGPSGRFGSRHRRVVRVRTNSHGIALAPSFKANRKPGGYAVTASVRGAPHAAAFALVNTP